MPGLYRSPYAQKPVTSQQLVQPQAFLDEQQAFFDRKNAETEAAEQSQASQTSKTRKRCSHPSSEFGASSPRNRSREYSSLLRELQRLSMTPDTEAHTSSPPSRSENFSAASDSEDEPGPPRIKSEKKKPSIGPSTRERTVIATKRTKKRILAVSKARDVAKRRLTNNGRSRRDSLESESVNSSAASESETYASPLKDIKLGKDRHKKTQSVAELSSANATASEPQAKASGPKDIDRHSPTYSPSSETTRSSTPNESEMDKMEQFEYTLGRNDQWRPSLNATDTSSLYRTISQIRREAEQECAELESERSQAPRQENTDRAGQKHLVPQFRQDEDGTMYVFTEKWKRGKPQYVEADRKGKRWLGPGKGEVRINKAAEAEMSATERANANQKHSQEKRENGHPALYDGFSEDTSSSDGE